MNRHITLLNILAIFSFLFIYGCATKNSITAMIDKKAHDRDGIYYIEFEKSKDAESIKSQLAEKGYQVKEGYYFDGLEKKEDRYKFLWFYGKEYESLKGVRSKERKRDQLIANGDMGSFKKLQSQFPETLKKAPEVEALAFVNSLDDAKIYHETFKDQNLSSTESTAQQWVKTADDLLKYRNIYGVSSYTDQKILDLIPESNETDARIFLDHFYDSKHSADIEINYLSKVSDISDLVTSDVAKKHLGISDNFSLANKKNVQDLAKALESKLNSKTDSKKLITALYDQHILSVLKLSEASLTFNDIDKITGYIDKNLKSLNPGYTTDKNQRTVKLIHGSMYKGYDFFSLFYEEIDQTLRKWNWKYGFTYLPHVSQITNIKASQREDRSDIPQGSTLNQIFFEEVYNKEFSPLRMEDNLDDYSYIMMRGVYFLDSNKKNDLPFHVIFKLDKEDKSYEIDEMILSNLGSSQTYYDGKNKSQVYYYDSVSQKMKRRGK